LVRLMWFLRGETRDVRLQVAVAVAFTTIGEYLASVCMGGYAYRFDNVTAYVPSGHGMVYLTVFLIATWLEILGTAAGAWKWALVDPVFGLSKRNPPSGVAV
jgi:hypothetical protein